MFTFSILLKFNHATHPTLQAAHNTLHADFDEFDLQALMIQKLQLMILKLHP